MSEYRDLIQKEKEMALLEYQEHAFRSQLERAIVEEPEPTLSIAHWFRKPAIAGTSVLLLIFLAWISRQFIVSPSPELGEIHLKNTLVQMLSRHDNLLSRVPHVPQKRSEESAIQEFQWSLKRVLFAIQTENAQDDDIVRSLSKVMQKSAFFNRSEKVDSGKLNI